ncbi:hypothetical protein AB5N19_03108 [Seiridium cardinale]
MFLEHLDEKHPDYLSRRGLLLKLPLRISRDWKILSEVKGVLDEIRMIQGVQQDQEGVLSDKDHEMNYLLGAVKDRAPLYNELRRMLATFEHMKQRAQSIVDSIERLLDMKQKQANLWEARTSRKKKEEEISKREIANTDQTLWWFTAVTVIFLPLSFMASFFALDIDKFPKNEDGDTNWPLGLVVGILYYDLLPKLEYKVRELRIVIFGATAAQVQHDTNVYSAEIALAGIDTRTAAALGIVPVPPLRYPS